ncbi:hypothetical protein ABZ540_31815 [Nocardia xishanensis]|uniref:hypothetical protein n=1 Tax=Nocardia xishanensis TaxID=238964 RepID=UPI0033C02786
MAGVVGSTLLQRHTGLRSTHIDLLVAGDEHPDATVLTSATFWHREDGEYGPDRISDILTVTGSDGLISDEGRPYGSPRRRLDHRILTSIIAFGLAMIFLVLAFIVMARAVAPTSDSGLGEAEVGKPATLTATPLMGAPMRHSFLDRVELKP